MWVSFYASYYLMKAYIHLPFLMTKTEYASLVSAYNAIPNIDPTKFGIASLMQLWEYHGYVWRWLMMPLLLFFGWKTNKLTVRYKYRREIKSVYDLIEIQAKHFLLAPSCAEKICLRCIRRKALGRHTTFLWTSLSTIRCFMHQ